MTSKTDRGPQPTSPLLSRFEVDIPPATQSGSEIIYDESRMILMIASQPAIESPEMVREPSTRTTFVAQETRDDN